MLASTLVLVSKLRKRFAHIKKLFLCSAFCVQTYECPGCPFEQDGHVFILSSSFYLHKVVSCSLEQWKAERLVSSTAAVPYATPLWMPNMKGSVPWQSLSHSVFTCRTWLGSPGAVQSQLPSLLALPKAQSPLALPQAG